MTCHQLTSLLPRPLAADNEERRARRRAERPRDSISAVESPRAEAYINSATKPQAIQESPTVMGPARILFPIPPFRVRITRIVSLALVLMASGNLRLSASEADSEGRVDYARAVKPLLRERCFPCHGALRQESELRLDTVASMRQGGFSGPAIEPGDVRASLLLARITSADDGERMPPEGRPLLEDEILLIRRWIEQGAEGPEDEVPETDPAEHWAFRPVTRPPLPEPTSKSVELPRATSDPRENRTGGENNARHPIDAFLDAEMERQGLVPNPPAEKSLLLRRVYLDLIGLPPTSEQMNAFLADERPDAWEHVVHQLLESPQYGERWGRHWMDVWRYSDWYGRRMVPDVWNSAPQIWRWRDWIVSSLNDDKGYDKMLAEMLAADEVSPDDPEAGAATGYLIRNWYALNPNDWMRSNVEHTAKAFMGLTFNCAHCHDHKYDPILQDDYFHFRAFFEPIGIRQDRVPGEADPGPFQEYEYGKLRKIVRLGRVQTFDQNPEAPTWFYEAGDERNRVTERGSIPPQFPRFLGDFSINVEPIELPAVAWYPGLHPDIQAAILAEHEQVEATRQMELEATRATITGEPLLATESATVEDLRSWVSNAEVDDAAARDDERNRLEWQVALARRTAAAAQTNSVLKRQEADRQRYLSPTHPSLPDNAEDHATVAELANVIREASRAERRAAVAAACVSALEEALQLAAARAKPDTEENRAAEIEAATTKWTNARSGVDQAVTILEDASKDVDYSAFGPKYARTSTGRRAALARWLTHRDHPLTARVAINHLWLRHFHAPLAADVVDFGRNGARPTHPELLDWLAVELMESGWRMKHIHRLIVTSQAYQRSSRTHFELPNAADVSPTRDEHVERSPASVAGSELTASPSHRIDPENRYLWRMNRGRMEAEVLRDSLLATAGVLDLTMGGQELENSEALTTRRRTLYYSCHPELDGKSSFGALFDAPDAVECYRRTQSVIPQQALALTNSELIHQLSGELSEAIWNELAAADQAHPRAFVAAAYERILSRPPALHEQRVCLEFLGESADYPNRGKRNPQGDRSAAVTGEDVRVDADGEQVEAATDADPDSLGEEERVRRRAAMIRALLNHNDFVTIR